MVEYVNGWEEFDDDLSGILDFPMESLGEEELDWDFSNLQCLGPIPSNIIMGPSSICGDTIDAGCPRLLPELVAPMDIGQLQQSHHVDASSSHIRQRNKLANNSGAFKTQSPVSVLESNGSSLGGMSLSVKSDNAVPVRTRSRSKPVKHVVDPWLFVSPGFSTSQKTLNAKKSNESKKKSFRRPVAMDFIKDFPENVENPLAVPDHSHLQHASSRRSAVAKKCFHCESTKTSQWREGPTGPKTLCNACGLRYRSGCLFPEYRPANSPSFTPSNHSNSRKKVIEMRNKAKQSACIIKVDPISPHPKSKLRNHNHLLSNYFFDDIY